MNKSLVPALRESPLALLREIYRLMLNGEVSLIHGAQGGVWVLPDRIAAAIAGGTPLPAAGDRQEFEALAKRHQLYPVTLRDKSHGVFYASPDTHLAWTFFQAGRASQGDRPATQGERRALQLLINLARATDEAMDSSEETGPNSHRLVTISGAELVELEAALEELNTLPDDRPGYVMSGPARAEWAMRGLLAKVE
jgi:hypothetical protein